MNKEPLVKAITQIGGQTALARALGVRQGQVWCWLHRDKRIPAELVIKIERATGGQVTRHELRPDIYPEQAA